MIKQKKIYGIVLIITLMLLVFPIKIYASSMIDKIKPVEYTEEYKQYLQLPEEQRKNRIEPNMYDLPKTSYKYKNPLRHLRLVGSSVEPSFTLQNTIPTNMVVKNQGTTETCWSFATIAALETNLALRNASGLNIAKVYDFSERHMDYATTKTFANNVKNPYGFNRMPGSSGNWYIATAYLTNGLGAINENEMPFQNDVGVIDIAQIQNKTVTTQVYDTIEFPTYTPTTVTEEMKQKMKEHIKNYGSISANIHGAQIQSDYYNDATGAIYCDNKISCPIDHAVSIIGWNDNYSVTNFNSNHRPTNNGAWKIKNSWGTAVGEDGFMYISYEDVNVYNALAGFIKTEDSINYENIYQYNYLGRDQLMSVQNSNVYLGNKFTKKTAGTEYLTQVAIAVPETTTCKVYVNPNGSSMAKNSLKPVNLKSGVSQTLEPGYHTLEFLNPLLIKTNEFAVVIECEGTRDNLISFWMESKVSGTFFETVEVESEKCFTTYAEGFDTNQWLDLSKMSEINSSLPNGDSTIKAFTVANIENDTLKSIKITTPPTKTTYIAGENFISDGMVVTAVYESGAEKLLVDYDITNGTNLAEGQEAVTISYEGKQVRQAITVEKNAVTNISIKVPPTKTSYKTGESFSSEGMVVEATYKNGKKETITNYTVKDGANLKEEQKTVTIEYEGKQVTQAITVTPLLVTSIEIQKAPNKTNYVKGQNFNKAGMIVVAIYENGTKQEITDYQIENGTDLKLDQTTVTIQFGNFNAIQEIRVEDKTITNIVISKMPNKTTYIQNKENLDLTNGMIKITYNDNTTEEIAMTSEEVKNTGFSNEKLGKVTVTLTYLNKQVLLELEIVKQPTAQSSDLSNAKSLVQKAKIYAFTSDSQKDYLLMDIQVKDIKRNLTNETYEYYYYLSDKQEEGIIQDWILIKEEQKENTTISFKIDTRDIENLTQLSDASTLYLYVKEVVQKGGDQKVAITKAMEVETNIDDIEIYIDNVKKTEQNDKNDKDNTVADGKLPQTGSNMPVIITVAVVVAMVGIICYVRYRRVKLH